MLLRDCYDVIMKRPEKNTAAGGGVNPRQLAAAVLRISVDDSCGRVTCGGDLKDRIRIRDDARFWFNHDNNGLFSFRGCCNILDLDPEVVKGIVTKRWGVGK